jgi:signal transduction histidine kinase/DNA-binding NarL/FixJ family response regulator
VAKTVVLIEQQYLLRPPDEKAIKRFKQVLQSDLRQWQAAHQEIKKYVAQDYGEYHSLFIKVNELEERLDKITTASEELLQKRFDPSSFSGVRKLAKRVQRHEADFLTRMDDIVNDFEVIAKKKVDDVSRLETVFLILIFFILILEGLFIFRPAVRDFVKYEDDILKAKDFAESGLRAKARFLSTMSHEIRTPMNAILSCANLLLDSVKNPENLKLLQTIVKSGDSLLVLINDILDFSKIESGKLLLEDEPFSLRKTTEEIIDLLNSSASGKGVNLSLDIDESVPDWISGDAVRYKQVLVNLTGNAVKFTKDRVRVHLRAESLESGKNRLHVSVIDNGIGISEEAQSRLFQDFSQVDASTTREFGGTGLGLAICKGIVLAMGGEIGVQSQLGAGSRFFFSFIAPSARKGIHEKQADFSEVDAKMAEVHPLKILMAEDNSVNQMVGKRILSKMGYRIDVVANGAEAVESVREIRYDVVLMDQHMPVMDGLQATHQICQELGEDRPKIYALTASAFKEDRDRCLAVGMDGFLTKPIVIEQLKKTLLSCSAERSKSSRAGTVSYFSDFSSLLDRFAGDESLVLELVSQAIDELPGYVGAIEQAIKVNDLGAVEKTAHSLKGALANFHVGSLVNLARDVELCGKHKDFEQAKVKFTQLAVQVNKLRAELEMLARKPAS